MFIFLDEQGGWFFKIMADINMNLSKYEES